MLFFMMHCLIIFVNLIFGIGNKTVFFIDVKATSVISWRSILSVPVLFAGVAPTKLSDLLTLITPSLAKTANWRACFEKMVAREKLDLGKAWQQCDDSDLMEGLYLKIESEEQTINRLKWVRQDFVQAILDAGQHHSEQPFIPNQLAQNAELYSPQLTVNWNNRCLIESK
ncbi:hypothetical protein [Snodgrassella communis]|uniref:hypothetical protein n=1 Tax=Snodgrassella communis TaxID=2946699 RepID=UPI001C55786D|nr:hypothetical protein [Snodgrassella communis]